MYHIFFIHSSAGGYLGCFHVLAIVHSAAVTMECSNGTLEATWIKFHRLQAAVF